MDFKVGDLVDCVDDRKNRSLGFLPKSQYEIIQIGAFDARPCTFCDQDHDSFLRVSTGGGASGPWCPTRFRKIPPKASEFLRKLMEPFSGKWEEPKRQPAKPVRQPVEAYHDHDLT